MINGNKKKVVIGILGIKLDAGTTDERWQKWRPTLGICQQQDLQIERVELLHQKRYRGLARLVSKDIEKISPSTKVVLNEINIANPWDFEQMFVVLMDFAMNYGFDPDQEEYLIHLTTGTHAAQISFFLLTEAHIFPGKLVQTWYEDRRSKSIAGDYNIVDPDLTNYGLLASRFRKKQIDDQSFLKNSIETQNRAFNEMIEEIEVAASNSPEPILLLGPTGAGKSTLARNIYELKKRKGLITGGFVEESCATLRGDLVMSVLFGHKKGSFTGASADRAGLLKKAENGLLFLDEIGELPLDEQALLLRAIEEKKFRAMGSDKVETSEFQLITGTNCDLSARVKEGKFRRDLLARIEIWTFQLPGLRERPEDIEPNLQYELDEFMRRSGRRVRFDSTARNHFLRFACSNESLWEGNFRDLRGAITRMGTLASNGVITLRIVEKEVKRLKAGWGNESTVKVSSLIDRLITDAHDHFDRFDLIQLEAILEICKKANSISDVGRILFNHSRLERQVPNDADRLSKFLLKFGIKWKDIRAAVLAEIEADRLARKI